MANICNYTYDPNILTQRKVNAEFSLIHKHLCYLESTVSSGVVTGANNGLSSSGGIVMLGQNVGQSGAPATLTTNREIPLSNKILQFSSGGSTFTLDMLGFSSSPRMISNTYLTFGSNADFVIFQGNNAAGATATDYPTLQLIAGKSGVAMTFCAVVQGFNFSANAAAEPLLITTSSDQNGTGKAGDIIISPARTQQSNFLTQQNVPYNVVLQPSSTGGIGMGTLTPSAVVHIKAGTATAGTAPLKFTTGVNLTTPEAGAIEFDGTNYFVTSSTTRYTLGKTLTATATLDFPSTNAQLSSDLTITVTGAADGDVVVLGVPIASQNANSSFSAFISGANTVTVRFNNYSSGAIDPASGTFRVSVIKY